MTIPINEIVQAVQNALSSLSNRTAHDPLSGSEVPRFRLTRQNIEERRPRDVRKGETAFLLKGKLQQENSMASLKDRLDRLGGRVPFGMRRTVPSHEMPDATVEDRIAKQNARISEENATAKLDAGRGAVSRLGGLSLPENGPGQYRGQAQGGRFREILADQRAGMRRK